MRLSAIVVHYRSLDVLPRCLVALAAAGEPDVEIVVVDNNSRDGLAERLARDFPAARVISNDENVGYARAVNQGIAATSGEYLLVMNPDCFLEGRAARTLAQYLDAHPRTGLAGPKLLNPDGSYELSARSFPDHFTFLFNRYSLLTRLFPRNRWSRRYLLTDWDHASAREVDWVSGACMMVRREVIKAVGAMDEGFFMFNEDVDWCRRITQAGWAVACVPEARAVHEVGASRRRVDARVILERHRGMIRYFHKHHPTNPLVSFLADTLILARAGLMLARNALLPPGR